MSGDDFLSKDMMDQIINLGQRWKNIETDIRLPTSIFQKMVGNVYRIKSLDPEYNDRDVIIIGFDAVEHHFTVFHPWALYNCKTYKARDIIQYITQGTLRFVI